MNVGVVGAGYVGLVTGACLAYLGHSVIVVDRDEQRVALLEQSESPLYEPGLSELMALALRRGTLGFSTDTRAMVAASEVIFIAVGTPSLPSGEPDLSAVKEAAMTIGASLDDRRERVIVNKSTVPIGSGSLVEMLVTDGLAARIPAGRDEGDRPIPRFRVASNPEFLREGSAIADTLYPDRIVLGVQDAEALSVLRTLYAPILEQSFNPPAVAPRREGFRAVPLITTDLASAEMIKYAANAFLATKISFINEIAVLCESVGADVGEVARGIGLDGRIGPRFLNAGVGWGGSCFGKDMRALVAMAREYHYEPRLLEAAIAVNYAQRDRVVHKLQETLKVLKGKTIGLLGLAFKPNTDDLRDAPALSIARTLIERGAKVKAFDPVAMDACRRLHPDLEIVYAADELDLAFGADALVLVTEWTRFTQLDLLALRGGMRTPVLIDARNVWDPADASSIGFVYRGMGRS